VQVGDAPEASALGAATLARRTLGFPADPAGVQQTYQPGPVDPGPARRSWARAVARSRGHATD
jgi:glycerol kinase